MKYANHSPIVQSDQGAEFIEVVVRVPRASLAALGLIAPPAPAASSDAYTSEALPPGFPSARAFNERCRSGEIPGAFKVGKSWAVRAKDFDAWAATRRAQPRPEGEVVNLETRRLRAVRAAGLRTRKGAA